MVAEARVGYKFLSESFTSEVNIYPNERRLFITKAGNGGAVKSLANDWNFIELSDGTTLIDFKIDVRMKVFPLEIMVRDRIDNMGNYIMGLMEERALSLAEIIGDEVPSAALQVEINSQIA